MPLCALITQAYAQNGAVTQLAPRASILAVLLGALASGALVARMGEMRALRQAVYALPPRTGLDGGPLPFAHPERARPPKPPPARLLDAYDPD